MAANARGKGSRRRRLWELGAHAHRPTLGPYLTDTHTVGELMLPRRMLRLLLAAHDEAPPWFWRDLCPELTARPLRRLLAALDLPDPPQAEAMRAFVDAARARLDAVPSSARQYFTGTA